MDNRAVRKRFGFSYERKRVFGWLFGPAWKREYLWFHSNRQRDETARSFTIAFRDTSRYRSPRMEYRP